MNVPAKSKYLPFVKYLAGLKEDDIRLSFDDIERILGFKPPFTAITYPAWWANSEVSYTHTSALLWMSAGWRTRDVDLAGRQVPFLRAGSLHLNNDVALNSNLESLVTPLAADLAEPAPRQHSTTYRIIRDTELARRSTIMSVRYAGIRSLWPMAHVIRKGITSNLWDRLMRVPMSKKTSCASARITTPNSIMGFVHSHSIRFVQYRAIRFWKSTFAIATM